MFSEYKNDDDPNVSDIILPKEIDAVEIEYMIYKLCNGDITRKKYIEENLDVPDFIEWAGFQKYDNYIEREAVKRYQNANK